VPEHGGGGLDPTGLLALLLAVPAIGGYLLAVRGEAGRRAWPRARTVCWLTGTAAVLAGSAGPLATAAHGDFRAHAVAHVLVGMLGPLLLVLGAPVTLALRALPVAAARRLTGVLRSRPLRVLTEPAVAVVLDLGGLWLLYRTPLLGWTHAHPGVHLLVHVHLVLAGFLLAAVLVGRDPLPHRRSHRHRAVALVLALAAHAILAKSLYAAPPAAVDAGTAQAGAMIMYYAGDAVELVLAVLLCRSWFAEERLRPRRSRPGRPVGGTASRPARPAAPRPG
jgi:putative membrane protein